MAPTAKEIKKESKKGMPFPRARLVRQPRDMRVRQLSNILAGLNYLRAPVVVCTLVSLLFTVPGLPWDRPIDHLEVFAGKMAVTLAEVEAGRRAVPIDLEIGGSSMDLTTDIGFANCLYHAANLREGGACMAAPVCGSFVFMSRGSTQRSIANPMGQGESCRIGNLLVSRLCVVLLICAAKCVWFCVEQPGTSIMEYHTLFQRFIKIVAVRKLKFMMGDYGAPTLKPSILYSSHRAVDLLPNYQVRRRLVKKQMVKRYMDGKGKPRVCGGADLKRSQAYPKQFLG
ncbi:unnamed protein product [Durusdinium trenchii]|uniref:Uncharacterized protein n=1 Tax=Durusdinium trenchii TaxID=1381693 RepID=A0ABP0HPB4_9DINO